MKVISLNCNHCGAPLEVSAKARFVTCGFCDARLAIEHTGNSYSTAVIEELKETTAQLSRDVAELKSGSAIEKLDADWERKRKHHLVTGKHGQQSLPTKGGAVVGGIVITLFGCFWTIMAGTIVAGGLSIGAPGPIAIFPLFGILFVAFGIYNAFSAHSKADAYERDLKRYQSERRRLVAELND